MIVNAIFDFVKVYNVQDRLDVVKGEVFSLEINEELPADFDVFSNKDSVLNIGDSLSITADSVGESKIRFMSGPTIVKDLTISVVDAVVHEAKTLGLELGPPEPKTKKK